MRQTSRCDVARIRPNTSALRISNCELRIFSDESIRNPQSEIRNLPAFGMDSRARHVHDDVWGVLTVREVTLN